MSCKWIMKFPAVATLFAAAAFSAGAAERGAAAIDLAPPSGHGRVVIMISGSEGPGALKGYAEKIAKLGYYAVVLDGREISPADRQGRVRLQEAIATARHSSHAVPGKIAVIGFALGGGGALAYAERQPAAVSIVIAYDPVTAFIARSRHVKSFVGGLQVPLVVFAAGKDKFKNCCLLRTVTAMDAAANELGKPMELVVYPHADHNFIAGPNFRAREAADAWRRTAAALRDYVNAASAH